MKRQRQKHLNDDESLMYFMPVANAESTRLEPAQKGENTSHFELAEEVAKLEKKIELTSLRIDMKNILKKALFEEKEKLLDCLCYILENWKSLTETEITEVNSLLKSARNSRSIEPVASSETIVVDYTMPNNSVRSHGINRSKTSIDSGLGSAKLHTSNSANDIITIDISPSSSQLTSQSTSARMDSSLLDVPDLDTAIENRIERFRADGDNTLIGWKFGRVIFKRDISCLLGVEPDIDPEIYEHVVNQYMDLIVDGSNVASNSRIYAVAAHFWQNLRDAGHNSAKFVARSVNMLDYGVVLIPIQKSDRYSLLVIWPKLQKIKLFDTLGRADRENTMIFTKVFYYLKKEYGNREWSTECVGGTQVPHSILDSVVLVCLIAKSVARKNHELPEQMLTPKMAQTILYEILIEQILK